MKTNAIFDSELIEMFGELNGLSSDQLRGVARRMVKWVNEFEHTIAGLVRKPGEQPGPTEIIHAPLGKLAMDELGIQNLVQGLTVKEGRQLTQSFEKWAGQLFFAAELKDVTELRGLSGGKAVAS